MLTKVLFYFLIPKLTLTQLDGDFWWLNDKVTKFKRMQPPSPKFEVLSELDNDDSSKIVFRDDDIFAPMDTSTIYINMNFEDESEKNVWTKGFLNILPYEEASKSRFIYEIDETESLPSKQRNKNSNDDHFVFHYSEEDNRKETKQIESNRKKDKSKSIYIKEELKQPDSKNDALVKEATRKDINKHSSLQQDIVLFQFPKVSEHWKNITITKKNVSSTNNISSEKEIVKASPHRGNLNDTKNICTYLKKAKCYKRNGLILKTKPTETPEFIEPSLICCVLPLSKGENHRIIFPDLAKRKLKRSRRSNTDLHQREFLLRKSNQNTKAPLTKIVTPDDDFLDPYWNIKNSNLKKPSKQITNKPDYGYQDYVGDYVEELPRPGLVGLYSDNEYKPPSWTVANDNPNPTYDGSIDYGDEDYGTSFGYSTIDPRRVSTAKLPKRRRPVKITTEPPEEELPFDIESQTISFQSNPNFQVLQGFKLLNLARTRNEFYSKITRRSTTESSVENDSSEHLNIESDTLEDQDGKKQLFTHCGITSVNQQESSTRDIGEAEYGSHPWLAVVVPSKRPQNVLCYATIVHPRAAITAGDCVSDYSRLTGVKEVVAVVVGLREIKDRSQTQTRLATVQLHPQWRKDNLAYNLAILHWKRPIRLSANVQPACLATYHDGGDCKFYGWGGFDQAMRQRARWQKASVVTTEECTTHFSKPIKLPSDAFCATVQARGTVTGLGGSLMCRINGRVTSVGVAVYRDNALVLIHAHEWILRAMEDLNIE